MISRVIEAKPEELRIFLEEAAGVSKYKERRKETEGRLSDTRENLARVEDIRLELGNQLTRLDSQAQVATQYRELEARLKLSQHLLWFAKQQDAVRGARRVHDRDRRADRRAGSRAGGNPRRRGAARGAAQPSTTRPATRCTSKQGAFYAANAEVTRLEQQLTFARESETRITQQVAQLTEGAGCAGRTGNGARRPTASPPSPRCEAALAAREHAAQEEQAAQAALPALDADVAARRRNARATAGADRADRAGHARRRDAPRQRRAGAAAAARAAGRASMQELAAIAAPATDVVGDVEEQLAQENADLAGKQEALTALATERGGAAGEPARDRRRVGARQQASRRSRGAAAGAVRAAGEDRPRRGHRRLARRPTASIARADCGRCSTSRRAGRTRSKPCCASA